MPADLVKGDDARDVSERRRASEALAELARARYGWEHVAEGVLAAAAGRPSELAEPGPPTVA